MKYMIKAQFYGILKNKYLIITMCLIPAYFIVCNMFQGNSWLSENYFLTFFSSIIAVFSGEILHWLTIDEIKDGVFDLLLLSKRTPLEIATLKMSVPIILIFILSLGSILLNNAISYVTDASVYMLSISLILFIWFVTQLACQLEFISLLLIRSRNMNVHFYLFGITIGIAMLVFHLAEIGYVFYGNLLAVSILLVTLWLICYLLKIRYKYPLTSTNNLLIQLFTYKKVSQLNALIRKDLSSVRHTPRFLIQYIIAIICPLLIGVLKDKLFIYLSLSTIATTVCIHVIYNSSLLDNRSNMNAVLKIAKVDSKLSYVSKIIASGILSSIGVLITSIINSILPFTKLDFNLFIFIVNFISGTLCIMLCRKVSTYHNENFIKTLISIINLFLYVIVYLLVS